MLKSEKWPRITAQIKKKKSEKRDKQKERERKRRFDQQNNNYKEFIKTLSNGLKFHNEARIMSFNDHDFT